jgi:protein transport protein SEC61 subunit gamma-like protein
MDVKYDLSEYVRVLKLASTPEWEEFSMVAKISGAGIFLIGFLGFLMFAVMSFVPGAVPGGA